MAGGWLGSDDAVKVYYFGLRKIIYVYLLEKIMGELSEGTDFMGNVWISYGGERRILIV